MISAADPLNLTGVITPGRRVPAVAGRQVVYVAGVPLEDGAAPADTTAWPGHGSGDDR